MTTEKSTQTFVKASKVRTGDIVFVGKLRYVVVRPPVFAHRFDGAWDGFDLDDMRGSARDEDKCWHMFTLNAEGRNFTLFFDDTDDVITIRNATR